MVLLTPFFTLNNRTNIKTIAADIDGKTLDEVEQYAKVFWERYEELNGKY